MLLVNATIVGGDANKYLTQGGMIWGKYLTLEDLCHFSRIGLYFFIAW